MNPANTLLNALNEIDGIEFTLDAWLDKAPANYGVLEMPGEHVALWADDKMIEQMFTGRLHIYVHGGEFGWIGKVQSVLQAQDVFYKMPVREYLDDIHMVHWNWDIRFYGPVEDEEPDEPEEPEDPDEPGEPGEPEEPGTQEQEDDTIEAGDDGEG